MPTSIEYASFLIRIWRKGETQDSATHGEWLSDVEHIQTGERWGFNTLQELLDFLRYEAEDLHLGMAREHQPNTSES